MNAVDQTFYIVNFPDLFLDLHCIAPDVIQLIKLCMLAMWNWQSIHQISYVN